MTALLQFIARHFLSNGPRLLYFLAGTCVVALLVMIQMESPPASTLVLVSGLGGGAVFLAALGQAVQLSRDAEESKEE